MGFDLMLTICCVLGEIVVLIVLLRRRVWRTLPVFCIYMAWALVSDVAVLYFEKTRSPIDFAGFYLRQLGLDSILQFMVLTELALRVWKRKQLSGNGWMLLPFLIAATALAIWPLAGWLVPSAFGPASALLFHIQIEMSVLRILALLLVLFAGRELSLRWKFWEAQVVVGLGTDSIVSLAVTFSHFSGSYDVSNYHLADQAQTLSYFGALIYWMFCFSKPKERVAAWPRF